MVITSEAHVPRQQLSLDVYCSRQTSAANPSVAAAVDRRDRQTDTRPFYKTLYDTRCYFNVRSKADTSQLNLPHGTNN